MAEFGIIGLYPRFRADSSDGLPLEGGRLYAFHAGTSTPLALYADAALTTPLPHPIVLNDQGEATFYYGTSPYALTLTDANDVPQWTIDPVTGTGSGGIAAAGIGFGRLTVEIRPGLSQATATAQVFPQGVLAMGLTVWVSETLGSSQGLETVGIGSPDLPDRWGMLETLTADTESTAGFFQGYAGQPIPEAGEVTLTAYGGWFDGAGAVFVTGHFTTLQPAHGAGYTYFAGDSEAGDPLPSGAYATEETAGVIELIDPTEVVGDTDATHALTIARLLSRTATPTRLGLVRTASPAAVVEGTNDTDAVTPLGVAAVVAPLEATDADLQTQVATVDAKLPAGTPLSLPRYTSGGVTLEATPGLVTTADGRLGVGVTPETGYALQVQGSLRLRVGAYEMVREAANAGLFGTVYSSTASQSATLVGLKARGTEALPTAVTDGSVLLRVGGRGHDGTSIHTSQSALLDFTASETWSGTGRGARLVVNTTTNGTTAGAERLRIDGNGMVGIAKAAPKFPLHVGGALACAVPASAPTDADLANGEMTVWLNGSTLTFRVRDGAGVLKTGTVALT